MDDRQHVEVVTHTRIGYEGTAQGTALSWFREERKLDDGTTIKGFAAYEEFSGGVKMPSWYGLGEVIWQDTRPVRMDRDLEYDAVACAEKPNV